MKPLRWLRCALSRHHLTTTDGVTTCTRGCGFRWVRTDGVQA